MVGGEAVGKGGDRVGERRSSRGGRRSGEGGVKGLGGRGTNTPLSKRSKSSSAAHKTREAIDSYVATAMGWNGMVGCGG